MNRVIAFASLLVASLAALAGPESPTLDRIQKEGVIRLAYREGALPFSFAGTDAQPAGYSVELCTRIADGIRQQLKLPALQVRWVPVTAESRFDAVTSGQADLECGTTTVTMSRQAQVDFSYLTFADGGNLLVLKDRGIDRVADLSGKKVAVQGGTTTEAVLRESLADRRIPVELVAVGGAAEGLDLVESGKVDGYAGDRMSLVGAALKAKDIGKLQLLEDDFSYEPYALMMRRGDPDFRLAVNRELASLYRSGEVGEVLNHWFGAFGRAGLMLNALFYLYAFPE